MGAWGACFGQDFGHRFFAGNAVPASVFSWQLRALVNGVGFFSWVVLPYLFCVFVA